MPRATKKKSGGKSSAGKAARKAKATRKRGAAISMPTYRALRAAYLEKQSIRGSAKAAGVCFDTAKRYIMEGRPENGMPAIVDLVRAEAEKERGELELDLRSFRKQYMSEVREALAGSLIELRLHNARTKTLADQAAEEGRKPLAEREIVEPSSYFLHQVTAHEKLIHLMERALGAADETIAVDSSDFTAKMTAEECVAFIRHGDIPERLR